MATVALIISDLTLVKPVKKALRSGTRLAVVEVGSAQPWASRFDSAEDVDIILVEVGKEQPPASWFSQCGQRGIPIIAIISDPNDRGALFSAGVSDCLLRPLLTPEIQARLAVYLQQNIKFNEEVAQREARGAQALEKLSQQLIQNERWITIGRVVAAVCHDITNHMQATQGALTLATEEPFLSEDLRSYLSICLAETRRVNAHVESLRCVYHPDSDPVQVIHLPVLLAEVSSLASDAAIAGKASVETIVAEDLPELRGRVGQLQFMLLGILLNIIQLTGAEDTAHIRIEARGMGPRVQILTSTGPWPRALQHNDQGIQEHALGLVTFREAAAAQNADLGFSSDESGLKVWISLPACDPLLS